MQAEIRSMNETLGTLAHELKHTNEHRAKHEKIEKMDANRLMSRGFVKILMVATGPLFVWIIRYSINFY